MDARGPALRGVEVGEQPRQGPGGIVGDQQVPPQGRGLRQGRPDEQGARGARRRLATVAGVLEEREVAGTGGFQGADRLDGTLRVPLDPAADQLGELGEAIAHAATCPERRSPTAG